MVERVRFKSRDGRAVTVWEVIKSGHRSVDIHNPESGRVLYSVNRDRLDTVPEPENQEPTP